MQDPPVSSVPKLLGKKPAPIAKVDKPVKVVSKKRDQKAEDKDA